MSVVDVGGFGGAALRLRRSRVDRAPRKHPRIWFWRELFEHINARWFELDRRNYPWENADRKILANLSRKYDVPEVMAMWDFYFDQPAAWFKSTGGRIYGMARDGGRLRDLPEFSERARAHRIRLNAKQHHLDAAAILNMVGL